MKNLTPQKKYKKKNIKKILLELNIKTNNDILEKLNFVKNKQGYIKELIKNDETIFKIF